MSPWACRVPGELVLKLSLRGQVKVHQAEGGMGTAERHEGRCDNESDAGQRSGPPGPVGHAKQIDSI